MSNWTQIENRLRREGGEPAVDSQHTARIMTAIRDARAHASLERNEPAVPWGWTFAAASALAVVIAAATILTKSPAAPETYSMGTIGPAALLSVESATSSPLTREAGHIRGDVASATAFLFDMLPSVEPGG